jgi:hypothetical protein
VTTLADKFKPREFISPASVDNVSPVFTVTVTVDEPSPNWKLLADNDADELESEVDDQALAPAVPSVTVKSAAEPVVELTSARREPLSSVTMLALTPIPDALTALTRSDSEFTPAPVVNPVCVPSAAVIVRVEVPRFELLLGNDAEYHAAPFARLWTDIKWEPMVVPGVAVHMTWVALDETARAASGPVMSLRLSRSFDTDEIAA